MTKKWTQAEALDLCARIEAFAPTYGCHVALTGGCLYKKGERKDVDVILYRIRQSPRIDIEGMAVLLFEMGIELAPVSEIYGHSNGTWIRKGSMGERGIDFLFPDATTDTPTDVFPDSFLDLV